MTPDDPRLFHRDEGRGEPVLLLHGLAAQTRTFDQVIARGKDRYRFIAVDLPRSGRSRDWASSTPAAIAEALAPFMAAKGLSRYRVFGHSFGGLVAIELAVRAPAAVSGLLVASSPALGLPAQLGPLLDTRAADFGLRVLERLPPLRPAVRAYFQVLWGEPSRLTENDLDIYCEAMGAFEVWRGMLEAARAIAAYRLPLKALADSGVAARVLWGDRDRLVPLLHGEHLATALKAPFTVLPRTGHCVPEERPEAVLAELDAGGPKTG